jgi:hypothetical protein
VQNAELRARVLRLRSSDRLERAGRELGLGMPVAGQVRYLAARPRDGRAAAKALRTSGWAEFQAPQIETQAAPVALVPATPAPGATPAAGITGPAATTAPAGTAPTVPTTTAPTAPTAAGPGGQPAPAPPTAGTQPAAPGGAALGAANQPSQTTGG